MDLDVSEVDLILDVLKYIARVGSAAREDVERHQAEVGVRVNRTVALVEQDDCGESRRGIVGESIPYLRHDGGPGALGRGARSTASIRRSSRHVSRRTFRQSMSRCLPLWNNDEPPFLGCNRSYQPRTRAKINGATIVASDSIMKRGVLMSSLPHEIFSVGTAPEYDP